MHSFRPLSLSHTHMHTPLFFLVSVSSNLIADLLMILICLVGVVIVAFLVRLGVHIPSLWRRKDGTTDLEAQNSSISDTMELRSSRRSEVNIRLVVLVGLIWSW